MAVAGPVCRRGFPKPKKQIGSYIFCVFPLFHDRQDNLKQIRRILIVYAYQTVLIAFSNCFEAIRELKIRHENSFPEFLIPNTFSRVLGRSAIDTEIVADFMEQNSEDQ